MIAGALFMRRIWMTRNTAELRKAGPWLDCVRQLKPISVTVSLISGNGKAITGDGGIGSDSHITVNAAEELQQLEYSQRLLHQQRNICCDEYEPDVASFLYRQALHGGAQATGRPINGIKPGQLADFIELDADHPMLAGMPEHSVLAAHIFASSRQTAIRRVWTGGVNRYESSDTNYLKNAGRIALIRQQIIDKYLQES